MQKIAIIGSGFIGRAWAISFARAGYAVALWDETAGAVDKALQYIEMLLPDLAANQLLGGAAIGEVRGRMRPLPVWKKRLPARSMCRKTRRRMWSSSGRFSRGSTDRRTRYRAGQFDLRDPALAFTESPGGAGALYRCASHEPALSHPGRRDRARALDRRGGRDRTARLLRDAGHAPIVMQRELDGFVMNRMQGALLEEAFRLVADGYASIEDIDIGIREGLALRWSFMGPFETIDLNAPGGVRDYVERYEQIYEDIAANPAGASEWSGPVLDEIEASGARSCRRTSCRNARPGAIAA